ncbi:hypothetical protein HYC85_026864 [Camellia sinensis]|uniref:OCRE domain-containing protein n=1 Tax=Camellia sinensis TaxID=4442 RepID=A0A7J7G608_CAMSI|nr:hypothetical protein HYC85_026864 [Camellia sinensis]
MNEPETQQWIHSAMVGLKRWRCCESGRRHRDEVGEGIRMEVGIKMKVERWIGIEEVEVEVKKYPEPVLSDLGDDDKMKESGLIVPQDIPSPTNVLVVRGLDENADEEMLRYEFYKHAPIKDLRLYDSVGWVPKEYNPDNKRPTGGQEPSGGEVAGPKDASSLQSGFVCDEASGYYYDASSGFYYDGNTGWFTELTLTCLVVFV